MRLTIPTVLAHACAAAAFCCAAAVSLPAQTLPAEAYQAPTRDEVVRAAFWRVLEREPDTATVQAWAASLQSGTTVRQMVHSLAASQEYRDRFITPYDSRRVAALLYRHVLAREPDSSGREAFASQGETSGWPSVIQALVGSEEYRLLFGDHGVPGYPVNTWDAARAELMLEPRTGTSLTARGLCLTVAVGGGAAECGDLRLAHPLPALHVLGRTHAPVLLYNSEHQGDRFPLVAARVTPPAGVERIDVVVSLHLGGAWTERGRRSWQGGEMAAWTAGQARRVAVRLPWAGATGVYNYKVAVTFWSGGVARTVDQMGRLPVVNRFGSPFGRGWWVAGVEQVMQIGENLFWMGGDGSAHTYRPVSGYPTAFVGYLVDRPDTIVATTAYPGARWERRLPGGARTYFDADGRHIATVNRLNQHTHFRWYVGQLQSIDVPRDTGYAAPKLRYQFSYNGAGRLLSVTAPNLNNFPARGMAVLDAPGDAMRVGGFTDPDQRSVRFEYDGVGRIAARTDKRGTRVVYGYDAGGKVSGSRVEMRGATADIVQTITAAESRGLAAGRDTVGAPVAVHDAYTLLDGPRTDVTDHTRLWLDQWGGPWLAQGALGHTSVLKRGDARFPALVTETRGPDSLVSRAAYDARGNVASVTVVNPLGDERNATTRYAYDDPRWPDFPTRIVPPEKDSTVIGYHANGNRAWQQDARGAAAQVEFFYNGRGQLTSTRTPSQRASGGARDSVEYDAYHNLRATVSPLGIRTTRYKDALGRDTLVLIPLDSAQGKHRRERTVYDAMDRVTETESYGPEVLFQTDLGSWVRVPGQRVRVTSFPNAAGAPDSVSRVSIPDAASIGTVTTRWRYDPAGRVVAEIAPGSGPRTTSTTEIVCEDPMDLSSCRPRTITTTQMVEFVDSTAYDPAGNVTATVNRRGETIEMRYDALNRLTRRVTPAVYYQPRNFKPVESSSETWTFPRYAQTVEGTFTGTENTGQALMIPADTAVFEYDAAGRLKRADNRDAQVRRRYYPGGALEHDTLRIRTYAGVDFDSHVYALRHAYDLNGRRTTLHHPTSVSAVPGGTTGYAYTPFGALHTVTDVMGKVFTFGYDDDGAPSWRTGPVPEAAETYRYDGDGRLKERVQGDPDDPMHHDRLRYDAQGKTVRVQAVLGTYSNAYSGLGALAWGYSSNAGDNHHTGERYFNDAMGNRGAQEVHTHDPATGSYSVAYDTLAYEAATGRLLERQGRTDGSVTNRLERFTYDAAGNTETFLSEKPISTPYTFNGSNPSNRWLIERTVSYYGADGKLRVFDRRTCLVANDGCRGGEPPPYEARAVFDEYRYDALGRRVLVRTRADWFCSINCLNAVQRTVWDGDQILYEISAPGSSATDASAMEADLATGAYREDFFPYGRMAYTHGGGIDAPLSMVRVGYSDTIPQPVHLVPFSDWSGKYDGGAGGQCEYLGTYTSELRPVVWEPGAVHSPSPGTEETWHCVEVEWPAKSLLRTYQRRTSWTGPVSWMGSLINHGRDPSGQYYKRNRYYDSNTGRFTQEDPIGLAGGLNLYGFAEGDPVSYSDPYGLCPGIPDTNQFDPRDCPPGYFTVLLGGSGGAIGGVIGGVSGAAGGGALCSWSGPGAVLCAGGGALAGAGAGAKSGAALGALAGSALDVAFAFARTLDGNGGGDQPPQYQVRKPGQSGKEAASDVPSWAQGERPFVGENGTSFARRLLNDKYGAGNWKTGPTSEFNQIKKFGDRAFMDPPQ